jgi:hypothetical protein
VTPPEIHGYAIVSDDDRIADAGGVMPKALHNEADWAYFQAELDRADLIALGRASHEATPNPKGRRRLVLSRSAHGLEARADGWWWNPEAAAWPEVAASLVAPGGRVGVPGGQAAFELFLKIGFAAFHLSRARSVALPGGRGLFEACERGIPAEQILSGAALRAGETIAIDEAARVELTVWRALVPAGRGPNGG